MWNWLEIGPDRERVFRSHRRTIESARCLRCEVLLGIALGWDYNSTMLVLLSLAVQLIRDRRNRI